MSESSNSTPGSSLQSKIWRAWVIFAIGWIAAASTFVYFGWQEIYPERPTYLIALDDAGEKLVVWYATDPAQSVEAFVRERGLEAVEQTAVGDNTLVLPEGLEAAKREDLIKRARDLEFFLNERFVRGIYFRFVPILIISIFGPPLILLLLGRSARSLLIRWLSD